MTTARLSEQDAYALKRALTRMPLDDLDMSAGVSLLLATMDTGTPEGWTLLSTALSACPEIQQQVLKVDPKAPLNGKVEDVYVPPLPSYATLSDDLKRQAETVCPWHKEFTPWAAQRSPMTPRLFLEAGGVFLISLAIGRRVCLVVHDKIFPHLYILWVAETTRYAKSTGLKCVIELIESAMPHMMMPHESTPEALIESMSGKLPENFDQLRPKDRERLEKGRAYAAQRGIVLDEASSLLGAAKKDYMAGLTEFMLKAYDAPERIERSTRAAGLVIVRRLGLGILGATTPAAMARTITPDKWEDGDMARYGLLFPEGPMEYDDSFGELSPPKHIIDQLAKLHRELPTPPAEAFDGDEESEQQIRLAAVHPDAMKLFKSYRKAMNRLVDDDLDLRLHGNYGRLPVQMLKIAICLATMDWISTQADGNPLKIYPAHMARAQEMVEGWRASLHRLLPVLTESQDSRAQSRILTMLKHSPTGMTARDISRRIGIPTKRMQTALDVLLESGVIEATDYQNPNGGHRTKIYRHVG